MLKVVVSKEMPSFLLIKSHHFKGYTLYNAPRGLPPQLIVTQSHPPSSYNDFGKVTKRDIDRIMRELKSLMSR